MKIHRRIMRLQEVLTRTGKGTSTLYDEVRKGLFPKPVKLGPRAVGWVEDEVDDHVEKLIASRDNAISAPNYINSASSGATARATRNSAKKG